MLPQMEPYVAELCRSIGAKMGVQNCVPFPAKAFEMDNQQRWQRPQIQFLALATELLALPAIHAVLGAEAQSIEGKAVSLM